MSEPKSWCTVCPLVNLEVGLKTPVYFAKGLWLTMVPDWLRLDGWAELLGSTDRERLKQLQYAFVVEYEAPSAGAPDPEWEGPEPRSIQEAKLEIVVLANLAMWIVKPSPACYELVFHAPRWEHGWNVQNGEKHPRLRCHPRDRFAVLANHDLDRSTKLHTALCSVPCRNSVWTAIHSTWVALQSANPEIRNLLLWNALEALFGTEHSREDAPGIARRIGAFVSNEAGEAREITEKVETALSFRRKLVHGHWTGQADLGDFGYETEILVRRALDRILKDEALVRSFCGAQERESYLDSLFS